MVLTIVACIREVHSIWTMVLRYISLNVIVYIRMNNKEGDILEETHWMVLSLWFVVFERKARLCSWVHGLPVYECAGQELVWYKSFIIRNSSCGSSPTLGWTTLKYVYSCVYFLIIYYSVAVYYSCILFQYSEILWIYVICFKWWM